MPKLKYGENYIVLFIIFLVVSLVSTTVFGKVGGVLIFPLFFLSIGLLQLYSGVVLDRSWVAKHTKEAHPFQFYLVVILCFVMGILMLFVFVPSFL